MKITRCEAWPLRLTLSEPFAIAYSTIDHTTNVFLRIETDGGVTGFGCAAHDEEVTGETAETVERALRDVAIPQLLGEDPLRPARILHRLMETLKDQPTAMAAVDMALWDIMARTARLPLYRLLGGYENLVRTSVTIGIMSPARTVEKAVEWCHRGFTTLKLKGGADVEEDCERIIKVREAVGDDVRLYFDANQGYSVLQALQCMETLQTVGAEFIEQPCHKNDLDAFFVLRGAIGTGFPVMADEAVLGPEDVLTIMNHGGADMYNIKLAKTGGIMRAGQLDAIAAAAGAPTMVGCMDEAGLGVAAGAHLALASPNVKYADLDGHLEFVDDPTAAAVTIVDGAIIPSEEPGLGFAF